MRKFTVDRAFCLCDQTTRLGPPVAQQPKGAHEKHHHRVSNPNPTVPSIKIISSRSTCSISLTSILQCCKGSTHRLFDRLPEVLTAYWPIDIETLFGQCAVSGCSLHGMFRGQARGVPFCPHEPRMMCSWIVRRGRRTSQCWFF